VALRFEEVTESQCPDKTKTAYFSKAQIAQTGQIADMVGVLHRWCTYSY